MSSLINDYNLLFRNNVHLKIQLDGKFLKASDFFIDDEYLGFTSTDNIDEGTIFIWNGKSGNMMAHINNEISDVVDVDGLLVQSMDNGDFDFNIVNNSPWFGWNAAWKTGPVTNQYTLEEIEMEYVVTDENHGNLVLWACDDCCREMPLPNVHHSIMKIRLYRYAFFRISLDGLYLKVLNNCFYSTENAEDSSVFQWNYIVNAKDNEKGILKVFVGKSLVTVGEDYGYMKLTESDELKITRNDGFKLGFGMSWENGMVKASGNGCVILWHV
ncbi:hypothetical protein GQ42DRAFT_74681 [Ramicandelaber brevisporus]|nr:hypothetical protein GQ42DRAFT_74681 [Ramicandelaber brevisporus]